MLVVEFFLFKFYVFIFIYLLLAVLGLCCCAGFSLVAASGGFSPVVVQGLLTAMASLVGEHRLWSTPPSAVAGPSVVPCPSPGDLPNPGIKPGSPVWQAASLLSEPPGRPLI